jgi:pentatricopeptide repeat protein
MNVFAIRERVPIAPDTAILCATIVVAPQLFGGAFPWSVVAIAGLSWLALASTVWVRRSSSRPVIDAVAVVLGLAWLWTCLQAAALPSTLAGALSLRSVQSAERLDGLAWVDAAKLTISYDPGATQLQILVGVGIVSAFLAARSKGSSGLRPLAVATVASAVLMGVVGVVHEALQTDVLFGVYRPRFTATRLLAPLMNSNHLAGFSLVGALVAAGLAAEEDDHRRRPVWIASSAFCTGVLAWTLSRGGIGALLFGAVLLAAWLFRRKRAPRGGAVIPAAVIGATLGAVGVFAGLEPILRRFENEGLEKVEVAVRGFRLLEGSASILGIGRGAFSSAFVTHEGLADRYTHPENLLVQWTTEWGLPVAVVLLGVLAGALWKRLRSTESPLAASLCIALLALALQNLADFSLEMAGVAVVAAALLGAVLPVRSRPRGRRDGAVLWASLGAFAVAIVLLGPRVIGSDTQSIVDRLARYMQADDEARFEATLRRGLALHPGEPALALMAAAYASAKRHPDAGRWLSVVMEEAPEWAAPHAIAAQLLAARGRIDQALLEIRLAEQRRPGSAREVLCEVLSRFPRLDYLERAAPPDDRIAFLNRTGASCGRLPVELRAEVDAAILEADPAHAAAALRSARRFNRQGDPDRAAAVARRSLADNPDDLELWLVLIRAHLEAGEPEKALSVLDEARAKNLDGRALGEAQARIEAGLRQPDAMRATLARLRGQAMGNASSVARSFLLEGELEATLGNVDAALTAYEAADAASATVPGLHRAASLALSSGRTAHALRIYQTLCRREPGGPACDQQSRLSRQLAQPAIP